MLKTLRRVKEVVTPEIVNGIHVVILEDREMDASVVTAGILNELDQQTVRRFQ